MGYISEQGGEQTPKNNGNLMKKIVATDLSWVGIRCRACVYG